MSLSVGILGLPNVGKSTLFNALTRAQKAESANYPFCTIEPNRAVVAVPDERVGQLARLVKPQKTVYATVDFVDIAGLVKGASRGEGLGNKFLANVREADALLHVVRCFDDPDVVHVEGAVDPLRDIGVIETELILADFQTLETRMQRIEKQARADKKAAALLPELNRLLAHLGEGNPACLFPERDRDPFLTVLRETPLLTSKKMIYCANVDEAGLAGGSPAAQAVHEAAAGKGAEAVTICAQMEEELLGMNPADAAALLREYGARESGLDQIAHTSYHTLDLISYLTAGPKEVHAWTIRRGWKAPQAAGVIHSDFERGFIRARVIAFEEYIRYGSETACREKGVMRTEGKEYIVQDGDVIEFLFNV